MTLSLRILWFLREHNDLYSGDNEDKIFLISSSLFNDELNKEED